MLALLLFGAYASGASLDLLEVGGPFGTPTATDATAVWWNPAGLSADHGTRVHLEAAPTIGGVDFDRVDPYGNGGANSYKFVGVVPYMGIASDLGVRGLGVGAALIVPYARGADSQSEDGTGRLHMREGNSQALYFMGGASWNIADRVQIGGGVAAIHSSWDAYLDSESLTGLHDALGAESTYTDEQIEDPDYNTQVDYEPLSTWTMGWSIGARADIIPDKLIIGATFISGATVVNKGTMQIRFSCPPEEDTVGRYGWESIGLCDKNVDANGSVGYQLPWRLHGAVAFKPIPALSVQAMGGFVAWSQYDNFDIVIEDVEYSDSADGQITTETAEAVEKTREWARDNTDSYWFAIDAKGSLLNDKLLLGGRLTYDKGAVPDHAMSPNNYDTDTVMLGLMAAVKPIPYLELGLSYTHHFGLDRTIDDSGFFLTLDEEKKKEDRFEYAQMNGKYTSSIDRIGITVRSQFGGKKTSMKKKDRRASRTTVEPEPVQPPEEAAAPVEELPPAEEETDQPSEPEEVPEDQVREEPKSDPLPQ